MRLFFAWLQSLLLITICLTALGSAEISLQMDFCNSDDSLSMDLSGENLNFDAGVELEPDSLLYQNGGSSTEPQCSYSYGVTFNGQPIVSGVKTDSGKFSWNTFAKAEADGSRTFTLDRKDSVNDGTIESYYGNSILKVDSTVNAVGSTYYLGAQIGADTIQSSGLGGTDSASNPQDGADNDGPIQGFSQVLTVTGSDKSGSITTGVLGQTNVVLINKIVSDSSGFKFQTATKGTSEGQMNDISMTGKVTGFPTQVLPPGTVKVTSKTQTEANIENLKTYMDEQSKAFTEKYPQPITTPLWYYLQETAFVDPIPPDPSAPARVPRDYYMMSMGFNVGDVGSSH